MNEELAHRLARFAESRIVAGDTPGVSVALTDREQPVLVEAYGHARAGTPWTPGIPGQIGSIHKSLTAVCIVALAEEGKIDLDAPVERYLPWFRFGEPETITIHHLLTHTGGLPVGSEPAPPSRGAVALLAGIEPCWEPGEKMWYSNTGYCTLGLVVEAVTGMPAADAVEARVLRPLGMQQAVARITWDMRPALSDGHDEHGVSPYIVTESADGSVVATAEEMTAHVRLLLAGEADGVVSREAFAQMVERTEPDEEGLPYGYGLGVEVAAGTRELSHSGGMVGHHAMMIADVGRGVGAFVLVNGPAGATTIAEYAMALLRADHDGLALPEPPVVEPPKPPAPADEVDDLYAGFYRSHNPWTPEVRLVRVNGALAGRMTDLQDLDQVGEHRFRARDARGPLPEYLQFDLEVEGRMQRFDWNGSAFYRALR